MLTQGTLAHEPVLGAMRSLFHREGVVVYIHCQRLARKPQGKVDEIKAVLKHTEELLTWRAIGKQHGEGEEQKG